LLKSLTPLTVTAGCDTPPSSLNYQPDQSIANGVITKVSATGTVCVFRNRQAHVVLDVFGVFSD